MCSSDLAKKSHWLGMGETKNGIALISHDARREILTVSANGVHKQLTLRKAGASGNRGPAVAAMAPVQTVNTSIADSSATIAPPPPVQPMPPPPPSSALPDPRPAPGQEAIVKQETEARMLVSDLLEIGMAQRRAYEEAQRRSSPGNPSEGQPETPKQP